MFLRFKTYSVIIGLLLTCYRSTLYGQVVYKLPFQEGKSVQCTRSTGHTFTNELNAFDLISNSAGIKYVTAARSGCIRKIKNNSSICGCNSSFGNDGNYVVIDHGDGTEALYLHLEFNSVAVNVNQQVYAGQIIGVMGSTGFTCGGEAGGCGAHLHFQVQHAAPNGCGDESATWYSTSIPVSFCDVPTPNGIPIVGVNYIAQACRVNLLSPSVDTSISNTNINFTWSTLPNANEYRIQVATMSNFATSSVKKEDNVGNATSKTYSLQPNTEYFWRVKSNLTSGWDGNDVIRRFTTKPNAPNITYPSNGATNVARHINFVWSAQPDANNYRIQVSENPLMSITQTEDITSLNPLVNFPQAGSFFLQNNFLWTGALPNKTYYWRIRVNTANGTSLWKGGRFNTNLSSSVVVTNPYSTAVYSQNLHYWIDSLPSTTIPFDNNGDIFIPTSNINPGYHSSFIYTTDMTNRRSSIIRNDFVKATGDESESTLEYWFDNNYLAKQTISFTNPQNIDELIQTNTIGIGPHNISYRVNVNGGMWSSIASSQFVKTSNSNTVGERIMEYWFDGNFENRQTELVGNANNIDFSLPTTTIDLGAHIIYYRFKIDTELWSSISTASFNKTTADNGITQMEHWFNNDVDNKISTTLTNLDNIDENISTNTLPLGSHILNTRFQRAGSLWSSVVATEFNKTTSGTGAWQYQYWIDSTIGFAKTVSFSNPSNVDISADVSAADTGWHQILSRFRFNNGKWSSVVADSFYKNTFTTFCTINNPPTLDSLQATQFLCRENIIINPQDGEYNKNKMIRKDLAKITYRGLMGTNEPSTVADFLPSLFGDLQTETAANSYYFKAAKVLSYLDYKDGIPPFNPSRVNFHGNDTIVRGYALKVLLEAWNIKPDATLPNPYGDLVPGAEVNGYVLKAAQLGIVRTGANFANFRPFEAVTRIEAFLMLYRLMQLTSKPDITDEDFYIPFIRDSIAGNNPSMGEGNFSSYSETPFTIKGVPSLSFTFNYNVGSLEFPAEITKERNDNGVLLYDQQNIGNGWNHNYNNYIIVDKGITAANSDDRYLIVWSSGTIQQYNPNNNVYNTSGVYDLLTDDVPNNPTLITIKSKSQVTYTFQKLNNNANILYLVSVRDRHNNTVSLAYENGYNSVKRLKDVNDGHGRKIEFAYLPTSNLIDSVSANAGSLHKAVSFEYIANRLVKYTNPMRDATIYNYATTPGQGNLITKIVMPKGNIIINKYGASNKLTSTQLNNSLQTLITAKPTHTATSTFTDITIKTISNGISLLQKMRSNKFGMPLYSSGPSSKNGFEYNNASNPLLPTKIIDSLTTVEIKPIYDNANGNLLSITKQSGIIVLKDSMEYNALNDVTKKIDARGNATTFIYNAAGQLIRVEAPLNNITKTFPNTNGTVDSMSNPSVIGTKFNYDSYGNLTQTKMPLNIISNTLNDAYGRLLKSTNANNTSTLYGYDDNDNMLKESFDTSGLNIVTNYKFDKNDNLIEVQNAKGNITFLTYNSNDELIKEQFGNAIKQYAYDADGRLKKYTSPNNVNFINQYNSKDLLVNDGYATYEYYTDNSLQKINKNGKAITYTYDALKRITNVNYNDFANNNVGYTYDANSNISRITYPGGFIVNYVYDALNRLTNVRDAANNDWASYTYLADGRVNTQTNRNGTNVKYFYDAVGRMDSMVTLKADGSIIAAYGFELDKLGNHKKESFNQPFSQTPPSLNDSIGYTYSNTNRLLTRNTETYSYDNNGNLLTINKPTGQANFTYDVKNNLTNYQLGNSNLSYEYDGLGQRRKSNSTRYVLDNAYNVLLETDVTGNAKYFYIHGLGMLARVKASNNQPYYYHHDFRGSTVAITNNNQTITHKYQYGAFGETEQVQEEDFNAYRYVGKYGVGYETKDLTFMRARYYQPNVGRFNSEDPIWAVNLYPYGDNNPIKWVDPSGLYIAGDLSNSYYERSGNNKDDYTSGINNIDDLKDFITYNVKEARASNDIESKKYFLNNARAGLNLKHEYYKSVFYEDETMSPFSKDRVFYTEINGGKNPSYNIYKGRKLSNGDLYFSILSGSKLFQKGGVSFRLNMSQNISFDKSYFEVTKGAIEYNQIPSYGLMKAF